MRKKNYFILLLWSPHLAWCVINLHHCDVILASETKTTLGITIFYLFLFYFFSFFYGKSMSILVGKLKWEKMSVNKKMKMKMKLCGRHYTLNLTSFLAHQIFFHKYKMWKVSIELSLVKTIFDDDQIDNVRLRYEGPIATLLS
jgi:hypothetical protein